MEQNFGLFFGLAIQMYQSRLGSDRAPFDRFMEGDDDALSAEQLRGLLTFINRGPGRSDDPVFLGIGQGNCVSCHGGAEFTDAAVSNLAAEGDAPELIELEEAPDLLEGHLVIGRATTFLDNGFSNIGVRSTAEDLGRGGMELGLPLSFVRQKLLGLAFAPELPRSCGRISEPACPADDRVSVDGAFKVPGLRNVELTGPYFHNGGQATLKQVIEFYDRQGDFTNDNIANVDRNLALVALEDNDEEPLIEFLLSLTDERVRNERGPFDHPQLFVPNGHPGDHTALTCAMGMQSCDGLLEIPPVGRNGRPSARLEPLGTFLGLEHLAE